MSLNDFDRTMAQLDERKIRFPNICTIWLKYLEIKKEKLDKAVLDANNMLKIMETMETDMSHDVILLTFMLMYNLTENTNTT